MSVVFAMSVTRSGLSPTPEGLRQRSEPTLRANSGHRAHFRLHGKAVVKSNPKLPTGRAEVLSINGSVVAYGGRVFRNSIQCVLSVRAITSTCPFGRTS